MILSMDTMRHTLILQAESQMAQYPQYRGSFADSVLGKVTKDLKTTLGQAFVKGDIVLVKPEIADNRQIAIGRKAEFVTAWSFRNKCWTSIQLKNVSVDTTGFTVTVNR